MLTRTTKPNSSDNNGHEGNNLYIEPFMKLSSPLIAYETKRSQDGFRTNPCTTMTNIHPFFSIAVQNYHETINFLDRLPSGFEADGKLHRSKTCRERKSGGNHP